MSIKPGSIPKMRPPKNWRYFPTASTSTTTTAAAAATVAATATTTTTAAASMATANPAGVSNSFDSSISRPLSRAAMVAESQKSSTLGSNTKGYTGYRGYNSGMFVMNASGVAINTLTLIPKKIFPKPKRNVVLYPLSWGKNAYYRLPTAPSPMIISSRQFSTGIKNKTSNFHKRFFLAEARSKRQQRRRFIRWWTITSLTVVLGGVAAKIRYERGEERIPNDYDIKPQSWPLYAYLTLPLKAISRLWGQVNSINLPVWLRSPSYRLYSSIFGVNLDEMDEPDLTTYPNLSEFFYRELKPGARPIDSDDLVSPADGKVLKFGVVEDGEIEQVKGMTYSIEALLGLNTSKRTLGAPIQTLHFTDDHGDDKHHEEFAKVNGISQNNNATEADFSSDDEDLHLHYRDKGDGTALGSDPSIRKELLIASEIAASPITTRNASKDKKLFFAVIYLAPGDYHRYHSPTNWVTTLRRHFIGELFSVAPFFQKTLPGLFVLNERVALLGYWKFGFFSMIPVGATNVGSIIVNFDKDLKTNDVYEHEVYTRTNSSESLVTEHTPLLGSTGSNDSLSTTASTDSKKKLRKNTVYEATYTNASRLLGGYPLSKGQEVGGFKLGLTVVLIFEGPSNFKFNLENGQKVKVGQSLGTFE